MFFEDTLHGKYFWTIWINFTNDKFSFTDIKEGRIYETREDPLLDNDFHSKLIEVINKSISRISVEDTLDQKSQ
jgi:hypothetical protein